MDGSVAERRLAKEQTTPSVNYVENIEKTGEFYSPVFGWKPRLFADGYLLASTGDEPGTNTGIQYHDGEPGAVPVISSSAGGRGRSAR